MYDGSVLGLLLKSIADTATSHQPAILYPTHSLQILQRPVSLKYVLWVDCGGAGFFGLFNAIRMKGLLTYILQVHSSHQKSVEYLKIHQRDMNGSKTSLKIKYWCFWLIQWNHASNKGLAQSIMSEAMASTAFSELRAKIIYISLKIRPVMFSDYIYIKEF